MDGTRVSLVELVERQNAVIKEQADIIDSLFLLLLQHTTAEELEGSNEVKRINQVAALKDNLENISMREEK
jgi:hypothetical protein